MGMVGSEQGRKRNTPMKKILLSIVGNRGFRFASLALFALLVVFAGGRFALKLYIDIQLQRQLGAEGYSELHDFLDSPVGFSEEWFDATPFSADLVESDRAFLTEWRGLEESVSNDLFGCRIDRRMFSEEAVSDEEWSTLEVISDKYSGHIASIFHLGSQPDYEISAVGCSDNDTSYTSLSLLYRAAKYLSLRAIVEAHRGNCEEAFEAALGALQLSARFPCAAVREHIVASVMLALGSNTMVFLASQCDDSEVLSTALKKMEELEPKVNPSISPELTLVDILDVVATLRRAAKRGVPVVFHHEMTGRELVRQYQDLTEYYPEIEGLTDREILEAASRNKSFVKRLEKCLRFMFMYASSEAEQFKTTLCLPMGSPLSATPNPYGWECLQTVAEAAGLFEESEEAKLGYLSLSSRSWAHRQMIIRILKGARSDFDLARLALAARIVELETGTRPTDKSQLIPRFFPEPLVDPFTQGPYVWDASMEQFSRPKESE